MEQSELNLSVRCDKTYSTQR